MPGKIEFEFGGTTTSEGAAPTGAKDVRIKAVAKDSDDTEVTATGWKWQLESSPGTWTDITDVSHPNLTGSTTATLTVKVATDRDAGKYRAEATPQGETAAAHADFALTVKAAQAASTGTPATSAEKPPVWHTWFAIAVFALVALGIIWAVTQTPLLKPELGLSSKTYAALTPGNTLAARVIGPVLLLGVVLVLLGAAMALVEWRGRFIPKPPAPKESDRGAPAVPDVAPLIKALGDLKGAALVLISGVLVILAVAWMTSSSTAPEPAAPTVNVTTGTS